MFFTTSNKKETIGEYYFIGWAEKESKWVVCSSTWRRVVFARNDELILGFGKDIMSSAIGSTCFVYSNFVAKVMSHTCDRISIGFRESKDSLVRFSFMKGK